VIRERFLPIIRLDIRRGDYLVLMRLVRHVRRLSRQFRRLNRQFFNDFVKEAQATSAALATVNVFRPSTRYTDHEPKMGEKSISTSE
jgi:branched-subunit amino acid aminotransferase/4-amino-4-deoxychorismate lyase